MEAFRFFRISILVKIQRKMINLHRNKQMKFY